MEEGGVVELEVVNRSDLDLIKPLDALAVFPESALDFVILWHQVRTDAMLLALVPVAFVAATICPCINAKTVLFIIFILALIHAAIVPDVYAHAFHIVLVPLTFVSAAIQPRIDTNPGYLVLFPVTHVLRAVIPLIAADAMLASECVIALVP